MMRRGPASIAEAAPLTMLFLGASVCFQVFLTFKSDQYGPSGGREIMGIHGQALIDYGASVRDGVWIGGWHRFFLPMFMHAGLIHIFFNMFWLYRLGPTLEVHFGSANFGSIYLLSGLTGTCCSLIFGGYDGPAVGASGAVFGMMGAVLAVHVIACWDWRRAFKNRDVRATALQIGLLFLITFMIPHVDHWGHLGGLLGGIVYGCLFEYWRKHRRIGLAALVLALAVSISGMLMARWMVFSPHYHAFLGVRAEQEGHRGEADRHYAKALEWAQVWRSARAGEVLMRQAIFAQNQDDFARRDELIDLAYAVGRPEDLNRRYTIRKD